MISIRGKLNEWIANIRRKLMRPRDACGQIYPGALAATRGWPHYRTGEHSNRCKPLPSLRVCVHQEFRSAAVNTPKCLSFRNVRSPPRAHLRIFRNPFVSLLR